MTVGSALIAVLLVAGITYSMRAGMIVVLAGRSLPTVAERMLRNVGPAVLTALAVNLAADPGTGWPFIGVEAAVGLGVAAVVGGWRRSLLLATASGMSAVWIVGWAI